MATFLPSAWRAEIFRSLSWGSTSASTEVTPSSLPMASAVRRLSPVSMTTSSPSSRKAATASLLEGLGVSATAIMPINSCSTSSAKYRGVLPWAASSSATAAHSPRSMPASSIMARLPPNWTWSPSSARTPRPWMASKLFTWTSWCWIFRLSASSTMAAARGCSEGFSRQ